MTTPRPYALVSLIAMTILTLSLGACGGSASHTAVYRPAPMESPIESARALTFRFDNQARDHVYVYLVGQRREWLLGRVERGAVATLQLPDDVLDSDPGFVQLAVLTGGGMSLRAARDPRAQLTIAQDPSAIVSQQWRMAQGQLTSLGLAGRRAEARR